MKSAKAKVQGAEITFIEHINFDGARRSADKGAVAADEIKFTRKVGACATAEFVADRVK